MTDAGWERVREVVYQGAIVCLLVTCLTYLAFILHVKDSSAGFLYLLLVVIIALWRGFGAATAASLLAVNCLNYFFIPPVFSFRINALGDGVALGAFEFTALVVSRLSTQAQLQARIARQQSSDRQKLYQLTRGALLLDPSRPASSQVLALVQATLGTRSAALFDELNARTYSVGLLTTELEVVARDSYRQGEDSNDPARGIWSRVLSLGGKAIGAVAVQSKDLNSEVVDAMASVAAIAIERSRSLDRAARAETAKHSEQLRTAVLDSLAHAFKTPLTTILAASSGLLEAGTLQGMELELITLIDQESERLNKLATQLLRTARLDEGPVRPMEKCDLKEITSQILRDLSWELTGRPVTTQIPEMARSVRGDRELIAMGIAQLVDNAAKYSTPGSVITISSEHRGKETLLAVHNDGPVIEPEDREKIFERFYRGKGTEHLAAGTGIGLSVTRRAAEAHGGRTWVESEEGLGTTFFFAIPHEQSRAAVRPDGASGGPERAIQAITGEKP
jgi:two-component system sensor histidine kinase KdpD